MPSGFATSDPFSTFFTLQNAVDLVFLVFLLSVLGLNTLLTISLMARRAPVVHQASLHFAGIGLAIACNLALLVLLPFLMHATAPDVLTFAWSGILEGAVNFPALVFFTGGSILIYETVKEISHILSLDYLDDDFEAPSRASLPVALSLIAATGLVSAFTGISAAQALSPMTSVVLVAVVLSGVIMLTLGEGIATFVQRNRLVQVLGLFGLLVVGITMIGQTGTAAAIALGDPDQTLHILGQAISPMSQASLRLVLFLLAFAGLAQVGYARKLNSERAAIARLRD